MSIFKKKTDIPEEVIPVSEGESENIAADLDEVMRKYDKESNTRIWTGIPKGIITVITIAFSVFCICMTLFSTMLPEKRLSLFMGCITLIGFLSYPANKKHVKPNSLPWYDIIIMLVGTGCFFYFAFNAKDIILMGKRLPVYLVIMAVVGILCLVELCRRCVGIPILCVAGVLLIYTFYNKLSFGTPIYQVLRDTMATLFYSTSGVIGTPVNVCYTYIVLFIIFGAFLERTGIANLFISFANRIAGWSSGGPAKVAVISSALCGMVSGSSVGNTVTTGSVTIPMMKKTGYKPEFAGAVEAAASTGGQIMPPIMGAAAFLMAEYMNLPYAKVAVKAILPAVLYFTGIFIAVHLEAKKLGLKGISRDMLPKWKMLIKDRYLMYPLIILIALVSTGARTMAYSAAISIACAAFVGMINFFITALEGEVDFDSKPKHVDLVKWDLDIILVNKREIAVSILLSILTFGIYQIYWEYLLIKNIRAVKKDKTSCVGEVLCLALVPFYSLYWWYTRGEFIKKEFSEHNYSTSGNGIVYLILSLFGLNIVAASIMQNDFNTLSSENPSVQEGIGASSTVRALLGGLYIFPLLFKKQENKGEKIKEALKKTVLTIGDALVAGGKGAITVAVACAMAGIISGCITATGLASTLINAIVQLAGNTTIIGLVLTMLCCIVLGMGVPTTANYCIMAATCAPILIQLGFPVVAAHFFVFYFGIVADITPPVALAAYAGSAIAKSNPMKTGLNATKLAIAAFIVPYIFAYSPAMLFENVTAWYQVLQISLSAIVGLFGVAAALNGHLFKKIPVVFRILIAAGGIGMMIPGTWSDLIGLAVVLGISLVQFFLSKKEKATTVTA